MEENGGIKPLDNTAGATESLLAVALAQMALCGRSLASLKHKKKETAAAAARLLAAEDAAAPLTFTSMSRRFLLSTAVYAADPEWRAKDVSGSLVALSSMWWEGDVTTNTDIVEASGRAYFTCACSALMASCDGSNMDESSRTLLASDKIAIVLIQMTAKTLIRPGNDNTEPVKTALDIFALLSVRSLPCVALIYEDLDRELARMISQLIRCKETEQSDDAYVDAALSTYSELCLHAPKPAHDRLGKQAQLTAYFMASPIMNGESEISVKCSMMESSHYTSLLKSARLDIFPPSNAAERDKYLDYIPPMFLFQSTFHEHCMSPQWLHDIMLWSMFIFLIDEYTERDVAQLTSAELGDLKERIVNLHCTQTVMSGRKVESPAAAQLSTDPPALLPADRALLMYAKWSQWVMSWPRILSATKSDVTELQREMRNYLLAHIQQIEDNAKLASQRKQPTGPACVQLYDQAEMTYATWLINVGGCHISAPMSLAFAACYMGAWVRRGSDGWSSAYQEILARELNAHVAAYCRIFNDVGSIKRDAAECNLNSINFPTFWRRNSHAMQTIEVTDVDALQCMKGELLMIGWHERQMADVLAAKFYDCLSKEGSEGRKIASAMRVYFRSGEMFSDMYLTRDVTNSVK